jgi:hypothetical protein
MGVGRRVQSPRIHVKLPFSFALAGLSRGSSLEEKARKFCPYSGGDARGAAITSAIR